MALKQMEPAPLATPLEVRDGLLYFIRSAPWSRWFNRMKVELDAIISPYQSSIVVAWPGYPFTAAALSDSVLSVNLLGKRTYLLDIDLMIEADVVGGFQFDLGGTATYSYGILQINVIANDPGGFGPGAFRLNTWRQGLPGFLLTQISGDTLYHVQLRGQINITDAGTLLIRFGQRVAAGTTYLCVASRIMAWEAQS